MTDIPEDAWSEVKAIARKAVWADGRGMIGRERNYLEDRIARAILADRAAQAERMARLEEALRDIRDGRGKCKTCGTPATGGGAGFTDCDCVRPSWTPQDPADIAARALSQEGSDA